MTPFALKPPRWVYLIFLAGVGALTVRALLDSRFANSSLLYVATPFLVSFLLFQFTPKPNKTSATLRYLSHIRDATIVMLATSAFLFEGFLCVLFFMPIFYLIISINFLADVFTNRRGRHDRSKLRASVLPIFIAVLAIEGVAPSTSFERQNEVTRTVIIDLSIDELKANMAMPIELPKKRHWFLSVFPLPVDVQAGSLERGDVHKLKFIYKRWFFTNIQEGRFDLRIDAVEATEVRTSVVSNTSYLSKYLKIKNTRIVFDPLPDGRTQVSLTIQYDRLLDPAWYFGPLQRFAVEQSGDYFISSVFVRGAHHE
tara:strand:+ start:327 stop:1265 length:939 start_codon:yes stop_codon:yes gene_type:complete